MLAALLTSVSLAASAAFPSAPISTSPPAGDPYLCDKFEVGFVQRDLGTAIEWYLDHDCHFGQDMEVQVITAENGQIRDRYAMHGSKLSGRTVRRVGLAAKPACAVSTVRVEASYNYLTVGDRTSADRKIYYDPNDNCGA